jgi:hypothetical protein
VDLLRGRFRWGELETDRVHTDCAHTLHNKKKLAAAAANFVLDRVRSLNHSYRLQTLSQILIAHSASFELGGGADQAAEQNRGICFPFIHRLTLQQTGRNGYNRRRKFVIPPGG